MRMKIPITGTVKAINGSHVSGDQDDPIRIIDVDLGNVRWVFVSLDIENEEMEIEVTPATVVEYDIGGLDFEGNPKRASRPTTSEERIALLENAKDFSLDRMTKDDLYTLSKSPRLKNIFKGTI